MIHGISSKAGVDATIVRLYDKLVEQYSQGEHEPSSSSQIFDKFVKFVIGKAHDVIDFVEEVVISQEQEITDYQRRASKRR